MNAHFLGVTLATLLSAGTAAAAAAAVGPAQAQAQADAIGRRTFEAWCAACHAGGVPGIPQLGDRAAWAPRIETGDDTLYRHALTGFVGTSGIPMPAKGGNPALSDAEVRTAVDYMVRHGR